MRADLPSDAQPAAQLRSPPRNSHDPRLGGFFFTGLVVSVAAIVLGSRWSVIDRFGIDLPQWDQWDAEGIHLLLPWLQGRPIAAELFTPHNEHYVVLTKLLNFSLTLVSGQWDQRVECMVNALFPTSIAAALLVWSRSFSRRTLVPIFGLVLAASWSPPVAWQNVISGFHSQQFFLLVLAFAAIGWLPFTRPGSGRWWLGVIAAIASLVSMASGLLTSVVVLALVLIRWLQRSPGRAVTWPTITVVAIAIAAGWFTRHQVQYHASMRVTNAHDFFSTAIQALRWPTPSTWCAVLLWLPWLALAFILVRRRGSPSEASFRTHGWILLGLGSWVLLQIAAMAYARGAGGQPPAARYMDTLLFGMMINLLACGWLEANSRGWGTVGPATLPDNAGKDRRIDQLRISSLGLSAFAAVWLLVFFLGIAGVTQHALAEELPHAREVQKSAVVRARAYLATHDIAYLDDADIPYPGAESCAERIGHAEFLPFFPVSVRPMIAVTTDRNTGFDRSDNIRSLPTGYAGPFGVIPGLTASRTADVPPLFHATWTSFRSRDDTQPREWIGASMTPSKRPGWLLIPLAGSRTSTLEIVGADSGQTLVSLHPSTGNRWHVTPVRAPDKPFFLRARCKAAGEWIGLGNPFSMPTISFLAWQLCLRGPAIGWSGALGLLACAGGIWLGRRGNGKSDEPIGAGAPRLDEGFYRGKSWGSVAIAPARDLPSLKLHRLLQLLTRRTLPDARLLEVGCGSGRILATIHQRDPALRLTGIDLSAEQIELAGHTHPEIEFVCGNGEALPFPDASFEYVIFFDYLEHIERPRQSLAEIYRVLKPGGQLHFICPAERQSIYGLSTKAFGRHFKERTAGHIQQFSRKGLAELTEESGFRVVERYYSYHLFGSLMDYALFTFMLHPRIYAIYWSSNPYYATNTAPARRGIFQSLLRFGNAIAYYESKLLGRCALSATAVHLTAIKPK